MSAIESKKAELKQFPIKAHEGVVSGLCLIGKTLFSCSRDKTVSKLDLESKSLTVFSNGHSKWVRTIYPMDTKRFVTGSWDDSAIVWNVDGTIAAKLQDGHSLGINAVWYDKESQKIYTGSDDKTIGVWDETGVSLGNIDVELAAIKSLTGVYVMSSNNDDNAHAQTCLIAGLSDGSILIFDTATNQVVGSLSGHFSEVTDLIVAGTHLFSCGNDKLVYEWDLESGQKVNSFAGHSGYVSALALYQPPQIGGSGILLSGSWDGTIKLWNPENGLLIASIDTPQSKPVTSLVVSPGEAIVYAGSSDEHIHEYRLDSFEIPATNVPSLQASLSQPFETEYVISPSEPIIRQNNSSRPQQTHFNHRQSHQQQQGFYASQGNTRPFSNRYPEQGQQVCRFFQRGNCRFGDQCRNSHVTN